MNVRGKNHNKKLSEAFFSRFHMETERIQGENKKKMRIKVNKNIHSRMNL